MKKFLFAPRPFTSPRTPDWSTPVLLDDCPQLPFSAHKRGCCLLTSSNQRKLYSYSSVKRKQFPALGDRPEKKVCVFWVRGSCSLGYSWICYVVEAWPWTSDPSASWMLDNVTGLANKQNQFCLSSWVAQNIHIKCSIKMIFSKFTEHHQNPVVEYFYHYSSLLPSYIQSILSHTAPGNSWSTLSCLEFLFGREGLTDQVGLETQFLCHPNAGIKDVSHLHHMVHIHTRRKNTHTTKIKFKKASEPSKLLHISK